MPEILEEKPLRKSGECANCGDNYVVGSGKKILVEYFDQKGMLTEPFNLCFGCYSHLKDTGEWK